MRLTVMGFARALPLEIPGHKAGMRASASPHFFAAETSRAAYESLDLEELSY